MIGNCDSVKFLGVFLQPNTKSKWNIHIESVSKKISKALFIDLFLLRTLKLIVGVDLLISVYFAYFQTNLEIRIICGVSCRCHCKPLFKKN